MNQLHCLLFIVTSSCSLLNSMEGPEANRMSLMASIKADYFRNIHPLITKTLMGEYKQKFIQFLQEVPLPKTKIVEDAKFQQLNSTLTHQAYIKNEQLYIEHLNAINLDQVEDTKIVTLGDGEPDLFSNICKFHPNKNLIITTFWTFTEKDKNEGIENLLLYDIDQHAVIWSIPLFEHALKADKYYQEICERDPNSDKNEKDYDKFLNIKGKKVFADKILKNVSWSVDGSRILVERTNPRELYIYELDGTFVQCIDAQSLDRSVSIRWGKDNSSILALSPDSIYKFDLTTSEVKIVAQNTLNIHKEFIYTQLSPKASHVIFWNKAKANIISLPDLESDLDQKNLYKRGELVFPVNFSARFINEDNFLLDKEYRLVIWNKKFNIVKDITRFGIQLLFFDYTKIKTQLNKQSFIIDCRPYIESLEKIDELTFEQLFLIDIILQSKNAGIKFVLWKPSRSAVDIYRTLPFAMRYLLKEHVLLKEKSSIVSTPANPDISEMIQ